GLGAVQLERFERRRLLGGGMEMFQLLLAMPDGNEDGAPSFFHRKASELPTVRENGAQITWLVPAPPELSPGLPWTTPLLLADVSLDENATWSPPDAPARGIYVLEGEIAIGDARARAGQVALVEPGAFVARGVTTARALAFGGAKIGERYTWW